MFGPLNALIEKLSRAPAGSQALDDEIRDVILVPDGTSVMLDQYLRGTHDYPMFTHPNGKRLHQLQYTRYTEAAFNLFPADLWWWHISHLDASVIPTAQGPGVLAGVITNGCLYEHDGRPARYDSYISYDVKRVPVALCCAAIKAYRAMRIRHPFSPELKKAGLKALRKANPKARSFKNLDLQHQFHWVAVGLAEQENANAST